MALSLGEVWSFQACQSPLSSIDFPYQLGSWAVLGQPNLAASGWLSGPGSNQTDNGPFREGKRIQLCHYFQPLSLSCHLALSHSRQPSHNCCSSQTNPLPTTPNIWLSTFQEDLVTFWLPLSDSHICLIHLVFFLLHGISRIRGRSQQSVAILHLTLEVDSAKQNLCWETLDTIKTLASLTGTIQKKSPEFWPHLLVGFLASSGKLQLPPFSCLMPPIQPFWHVTFSWASAPQNLLVKKKLLVAFCHEPQVFQPVISVPPQMGSS